MAIERRVVVGLSEEGLDGEEDGLDGVAGAPVLFEDVEADVAVLVHVGVEAWRHERHLRGLEGIPAGEAQLHLVSEPLVDSAADARDAPRPNEHVVALGESADAAGRVHHQCHQL